MYFSLAGAHSNLPGLPKCPVIVMCIGGGGGGGGGRGEYVCLTWLGNALKETLQSLGRYEVCPDLRVGIKFTNKY